MSDLEVKLLTLCDFAMTSSDGKLSVIGIFDRMFVPQMPAKFSRFFIVLNLTGKADSDVKILFEIKSPSGEKPMTPKEINIKIGNNGKANIITDVINLPLSEFGEHALSVKSGDKILDSVIFYVSKAGNIGDKKSGKTIN